MNNLYPSYADLSTVPLVPVIVINNLEDAIPLAQALKNAGIKNLEVTLRTPCACQAIELLRSEFPDLYIGAGTIINIETLNAAVQAGAQFIVSPGVTSKTLDHWAKHYAKIPFFPGVSTPSEVLQVLEYGINYVKFFPAENLGGVGTLKSLAAVFPTVKVLPSGGINLNNVANYCKLASVFAVSGSWFIPNYLIQAKDWQGITTLAQQALTKVLDSKNS